MSNEKLQGICIKSYQDEDDLDDYECGVIDEGDIRTYSVGEVREITTGYDEEYWKAVDQDIETTKESVVSYEKLVERVLSWADDKGIFAHSCPKCQWKKTQEEVEELFVALRDDDRAETIDAYGDIFVTIIIGAKLSGLDLKDCLESALNVIEKRNGKMVDGIFVKDGD